MGPRRPAGTWPSPILAASAVGLLSFAYLLMLPPTLSVSDESFLLHGAKRIVHGEALYRDFFDFLTPGSFYLYAAAFAVGGVSITTARVTTALLAAASAGLTYLLVLHVASVAEALVASLLVTVVCTAAWNMASHHWVATTLVYPLLLEPLSSEELISEPAGARQLPRVLALVWNQVAFALSEYPRSFLQAGRAYPDRASTMVLTCVGIALGLLVWHGRPAARRAAVGLASLVLGVYVVIALGRVVLESPAFPLTRLATQARYHYVTGIPIIIVVCLAVQETGRIGWLRGVPRVPLLVAVLALGAWAHTRSGLRIDQNLRPRSIVEATLRGIASEVSLRPPGAIVYLENGTNPVALFGPMIPNALFPGRAAIFLLAHEDDRLDGRSVRFVERDPRILARYQSRPTSRLARLLVPPDAVDRRP